MADWDNSRWTYSQVLAGGTGVYYMKDNLLRYSAGVKTMQTKLNSAGYNCGTPDGKFGSGTDAAVKNFQRAKGLTVDGKAGKNTLTKLDSPTSGGSQASILKSTHGTLISSYAATNGIDENVLGAFILVESRGAGFSNGKLVIRLENHQFVSRAGSQYKNMYFTYGSPVYTGHKYRKNVNDAWITCHTGQTQEHDAFEFAKTLDSNAAYESISMGLGQIMGFNYPTGGYSSAEAMYDDYSTGEDKQIAGMINFILADSDLLQACIDKDYDEIALIYNGSASYAPLLEAAYTEYEEA